MIQKTQFLIAAPQTGAGKTTLSLALMRHFTQEGSIVQAYKCGPDYIDPHLHYLASRRPSLNLDLYMSNPLHARKIYKNYLKEADLAIVEGMMGLYDGAQRAVSSSVEVALCLDIPVILVIDAQRLAYSVAPLLYGFKNFDRRVAIAGVIFNQVNSEAHYQFLLEACQDVGLESLGYLPSNPDWELPERHLGLDLGQDMDYEQLIAKVAEQIPPYLDLEKLRSSTQLHTFGAEEASLTNRLAPSKLKIAVAKDRAFSFLYYLNIERLAQCGELIYFSPIRDEVLPSCDLVYLAGGYPEAHLEALQANESLRKSILDYCEMGGKVYAECGGLMYLSREIQVNQEDHYQMVGFLDLEIIMPALTGLQIGYRTLQMPDFEIKGHEFHLSEAKELAPLKKWGEAWNARKMPVSAPIYQKKNVWASYVHQYWGEKADFLEFILSA